MRYGVNIIADEQGNIIEENGIVIEDGKATTLCKGHCYVFEWDFENRQ